jgi:hypothetical protein
MEQAAQATPQVQAAQATHVQADPTPHVQAAPQTLHDFVLNLLSDPQALTSFEQDPAAMLDHAGLNQISAADVQEVMPLVIDFVPAHAEALDSVLSQLPLDSVDTGQLGAIQQLQFVTQALGGIPSLGSLPSLGGLPSLGSLSSLGGLPSLDAATTMASSDMGTTAHVNTNSGAVFGVAGVNTPLGAGGGSLQGDLQHGVHGVAWSATPAGTMHTDLQIPGLGTAVPSLGGGLPSGFSALSDVTDALDGHLSSVTGSMTEATNAANLVAGAIANPADLAGALANPAAAVTALTGTAESMTSALPAPANAVAGSAVQSATSATHGVVSEVTSHLPAVPALGSVGNLANVGGLGGHLPALDPTQALSTVQGLVGDVTGNLGSQLPTGALGSVGNLGHLDPSAATHALSTVQGVVSNVATHSAVTDVTGAGTGNPLGVLDHTDVGSEVGHLTSDLHLPSLF